MNGNWNFGWASEMTRQFNAAADKTLELFVLSWNPPQGYAVVRVDELPREWVLKRMMQEQS